MTAVMHDTIVVTSWNRALLKAAHSKAKSLMTHVSGIVPGTINGYTSFMVAPDGSKEGWAESDEANTARETLLAWMDSKAYADGSNSLEYATVRFGDQEAPEVSGNNLES
jgi:hypothetical protein